MATPNITTYHTQTVGNVDVFYRAAGPVDAPAILLLHGFPSSSHMFRNLIPQLAGQYRVIAPDFPGFGSTVAPPRGEYDYTFDNLAQTIDEFTAAIGLEKFAIYVFDYGAPVGFRIATAHPERITAIISQNGNAYKEGLTDGWNPIRAYWENDTQKNRDALRSLLTRPTTEFQYTHGAPEDRQHHISPDAINHDQAILDRDAEIQLDLFGNYKTNVTSYPQWQAYLRTHQPPVLAIWGKNDPFFGPAGAEAFKRDVPQAKVELLDAGHFTLETHSIEVAEHIGEFLSTINARK
ncbi:alpha/beta hydrolase [Oscillatoria sp. CS-180]|uniref:alpha/beta fold hydrolase n=1 Tax=Oscillatoria sp. CS-180 TaxID=3021720 RepID=UPI002331554A|nr:alpha/beta hydrolase [Oscillatoria sp. CS-180]MDB9528689.1 alpha/beta hydrolase [Oscillatoria sp. CS-180]